MYSKAEGNVFVSLFQRNIVVPGCQLFAEEVMGGVLGSHSPAHQVLFCRGVQLGEESSGSPGRI